MTKDTDTDMMSNRNISGDVVSTPRGNTTATPGTGTNTDTTHIPPIPLPISPYRPHEGTADGCADDMNEIRFEPAIPFDKNAPNAAYAANAAVLHNTTTSTTFDDEEDDSFYYADEASLYSIAENSREDMIDNTTTTSITANHSVTGTPTATATVTPSTSNSTAPKLTKTPTTGTTNTDTNSSSNSNSNNSNNHRSKNSHGNTNSSQTTVPMNNVTSFELRKEVGVELSYAGQLQRPRRKKRYQKSRMNSSDNNDNGSNLSEAEDGDVITKASDETFRTYYVKRSNATNCGSCSRWYHPKCRTMVLLLLILLIGMVFLAASLTIYQSRKKQQQQSKSVNSIESGKDDTDKNSTTSIPSMAPTLLRKPTQIPVSADELKYQLSQNYVYNSIKTCPGTVKTFFDPTTVQGQVFALLVQEVNDNMILNTNDGNTNAATTAIPAYEFASYHSTSYLREKYGLNMLYLSTNGTSSWKDNTNWMTMTNHCLNDDKNINDAASASSASSSSWYGVRCSNSTSGNGSGSDMTITTQSINAVSSSTSSTCDATSSSISQPHIVSIDLSNNGLGGTLPDEFCCLPCVQRINVSNNSITGDILWCVGEMATLTEFNVNYNPLTGGL